MQSMESPVQTDCGDARGRRPVRVYEIEAAPISGRQYLVGQTVFPVSERDQSRLVCRRANSAASVGTAS